ncbi:chemotaxis protein CheW [Natrinema halophilum]|uniref:Chemotaxis protein CheW n=1 Tax=Natrinema halophilum TaxID=1699371 RepID=A0A7D5GM85_9EURY|nr:chemotaxis protein CheW [Natrinema halophilum]QLG50550.1 chemotaxis protein CheW [Natrinema halophilum]
MAPDLSEKLLGIDIDNANRTPDGDGNGGGDDEEGKHEELAQFVFVGVGEHRLALPVDEVRTLTEPPATLTRVPRSPPAIEGLMDLRGEITAVIDPQVHFPVNESRAGREQLLVLDRPNDQQSAAIRVDEVIGVETIPESNVIDDDSLDDSELTGHALEHPLVVALVTQEREGRTEIDNAVTDEPDERSAGVESTNEVSSSMAGVSGSAALTPAREAESEFDRSMGETFEMESTEEDGQESDDTPQEIIVEATALIDVDRLLLASGQA